MGNGSDSGGPPPPPETAAGQTTRSGATPWKIATGVIAAVAVALGVWAITLNQDRQDTETAASSEIGALRAEKASLTEQVSDLEDENAALAAQSEKVADRAKTTLTQAVVALGVAAERLNTSQQQVADATTALDRAGRALNAAEGDLATARAERDHASALAENAQVCTAGSLKALTLIVDDDVEGVVDALDLVAPSCEAAFKDANQPSS